MIAFTREEIAKRRRRYEEEGFQRGTFDYKNKTYHFYLLPEVVLEVYNHFPRIVQRMSLSSLTPESLVPETDILLGLAKTVPITFRPFLLREQVDECVYFNGWDDPCIVASSFEIHNVRNTVDLTPEEKDSYLRMRREFFEEMVHFASRNNEKFTPKDVEEFRLSRDLFKMVLS